MIRKADHKDIERVLEMGSRFIRESKYGEMVGMESSAMAQTFDGLLASDDGVVLVQDLGGSIVGMIAMVIYAHPFSGSRTAQEIAWWVDPESRSSGAGVRLLHAAEEWAREHNAVAIQMIAPDARVGALYQRMGYQSMETAFHRSLRWQQH